MKLSSTQTASTHELERKVFHLQTLYEVAQALNVCRDSARIYREVLSILMGTFGVEYGLALNSTSQNGWQVVAERGFENPNLSKLESELQNSHFSRKTAKQKKALLQKFVKKTNASNVTENSSVWLEFTGHDKVFGGLFLGMKLSGESYSETDHELLDAVASHTTTALENLRLYEFLKQAQERLQLENIALREEVQKEYESGRIIGQSDSIRKVLGQIKNVAKNPTNVMIYGETGTGKELVAKTTHYLSPRKDGPFVPVNSTAIPENLVESQFFGIESGVATGVKKHIGYFEQADGGTLFIDEIGDMPLSSQAKILRVLQERSFRRVGGTKQITVDVRVIVATNKDLEKEIKKGRFREDLFFRLNVLELRLPPLRKRREDIPLLVNHFTKKYEKKLETEIKGFSKKAMQRLMEYDWPGNIRELENTVERAITLAGENAIIQPEDLSYKIKEAAANIELPAALSADSLRGAVDKLEKHLIQEALDKYNWNKSEVARKLGLSRLGLQKKIDRLGIGSKV
ncbi:sigma-54-dependent Fis family transcriptional regulator [candidate division KSB1 bacterium]|nr:sigma-54-dependent Fis family transcriptional regulator [candidate division KSB1 bacterium]NIR68736.1 sigma-54-dependent Fis family transcriptional regulator [candidate division KSB1 bacterium]NIS25553.1 sigma-54-dependent Fis family transcriptional regulator [candidate division KSB1 bacterium]NIT72446.1 sigma-54-dependent Fis family transcriptional regulator [candidate division KSB1 bacterium]NIU26230.1 sigma-54-dependent Fis family transcriptional regulator [candidate division KSB1 bacteri